MSTDNHRPQTAARPRTGRPTTSAGQAEQWSEEDYDDDDDDDVGMFSFARPGTGEAGEPTGSPTASAPYTPYSGASRLQQPYSPFQFAFSPYGSAPPTAAAPSTAAPSERAPATGFTRPFGLEPVDEALPMSPAAAYAQQVQARGRATTPPLEVSSLQPHAGPRKRGSWQSSDSPNHVVGNPYEEDLRRQVSQRTVESGPDKIDVLSTEWADEPMRYVVDDNGQAIMLDDIGEPLRLATTAEQKMIAAAELGTDMPYTDVDEEGSIEDDDSPYPEVRASVSNYDDPDMPVLTFRSWTIGLTFCIIMSAANCFFSLRYPAPLVTPIITQVLSYPLGKAFARYLPYQAWTTPRWARRLGVSHRLSLNPGPFNIKEHTVLVIMANISTSAAYGLNYSLAAEKGYGQYQPPGFDILLVISTQVLGFGAAGLCRRFVVWPAGMIWPQNLVFCTLLNTLHAESETEERGPTRLRFFLYVLAAAFVWYWVPGASPLSAHSLRSALTEHALCRFPLCRALRLLLGLLDCAEYVAQTRCLCRRMLLTGSPAQTSRAQTTSSSTSSLASRLASAWACSRSTGARSLTSSRRSSSLGGPRSTSSSRSSLRSGSSPLRCTTPTCVVSSYLTFSAANGRGAQVWNTAYLPMSTSGVFDRFGAPYNTGLVVDVASMSLNETAYKEYSPLFLPITYATAYGVSFMLATAVVVHTALYYGKDIVQRIKRTEKEKVDVHMRLMLVYPEVPDWWYLVFLAIAIGLSIIAVAVRVPYPFFSARSSLIGPALAVLGHVDARVVYPRRHRSGPVLHPAGLLRLRSHQSAGLNQPYRRAHWRLHHPRPAPRQHGATLSSRFADEAVSLT